MGFALELARAARKSPAASIGLIMIFIVVLGAIFAPVLTPYDPVQTDLRARSQPPSWDHLLGTDHMGRDILTRILHGSRISLFLGLGSVAIGAGFGVTLGLISGYVGGWFDNVFMRLMDILLAFRLLILAIAIVAILGPSVTNVMVAIGISLLASFARLARGEVLSARERDYVLATHAAGGTALRIMFRHILPNIMAPLIVFATLRLGLAILSESALSFLGLGPSPPTPAWGLMISEGLSQIRSAWWTSTIPGAAITLVVLAFNLFGDGLRDSLDPRLRRSRG
jgi:peptide/nickel transport system permease protein